MEVNINTTPTKVVPKGSPRTSRKRKRKSVIPAALQAASSVEVNAALSRYKDQYNKMDRQLCAELQSAALQPLEAASRELVYKFVCRYGVSRTFPGLAAASYSTVLQPVTDFLQEDWQGLKQLVTAQPCAPEALAAVHNLTRRFDAHLGRKNLSAASKIANMLGLPVPIFDSRCRIALKLPATVGYQQYCAAWSDAFALSHTSFLAAARAVLSEDQSEEWSAVPSTEWLAVRGFDNLLWQRGG